MLTWIPFLVSRSKELRITIHTIIYDRKKIGILFLDNYQSTFLKSNEHFNANNIFNFT